MRSTLKPHFLDGFSKGLREKYTNTSSKDLPKRAKKTALRLDEAQTLLGSTSNGRGKGLKSRLLGN